MNYTEAKKLILASFAWIVGQKNAVQTLINSALSFFNAGELISPLIVAKAGTGKTALLYAYAEALKGLGLETLIVSPSEFRKAGDEKWAEIMNLLCERQKDYALLIDEAHELFQTGATQQLKKIGVFVSKALDGNFKGGHIPLGDNIVAGFSRGNCVIALATNYPGRIPEHIGGDNGRARVIRLESYSTKELLQILVKMLEERHLVANEESLKIIANCGRGTARPMEQIARELAINLQAARDQKKTINKADILDALKQMKMFPRGLNVDEMRMLEACKTTPIPDSLLKQMFPNSDAQTIRESRAYLMLPTEGKNGEDGQSLMLAQGRGAFTSDKGRRYLADCKAAGFSW